MEPTIPSVTLTTGTFTGRTFDDGIARFAGVPTAASAAGTNRFMPPQELTPLTEVYDATIERICSIWDMDGYTGGMEDCISVDIFQPAGAAPGTTSFPINMWIHGGGFQSENPFFVGLPVTVPYQKLKASLQTITFLIHYRLGALGWMAHPAFVGASFQGTSPTNPLASGNWGMMDSLHATKFAKDNAAALGGDPTKISVYGESAGGAHVMMLMASPFSEGVVSTYIAESPYISFTKGTFSLAARKDMSDLFAFRTGCDQATDKKACFQDADINKLIPNAGFAAMDPDSIAATASFDAKYGSRAAELVTFNTMHIWPVVDGLAMVTDPLTAYATTNAGITLVVGHNADEYTTFCYYPPMGGSWACNPMVPDLPNHAWMLGTHDSTVEDDFATIFAAVMAKFSEKTIVGTKMNALYQGLFYSDIQQLASDAPEQRIVQMGTDAWFTNGNDLIVAALLSNPARAADTVYHYVFGDDTDGSTFPKMGACHGCELTYVLGFYLIGQTYLSSQLPTPLVIAQMNDAEHQTLGKTMNTYWSGFFYNKDPNVAGEGLPTWKAMSATERNTMVFQAQFGGSGALLNPCVQFAICRTEPTKDFRKARKMLWSTGPAGQVMVPDTCGTDMPKGTFSHIAMGGSCPAYSCAAWCNAWTGGLAPCASCPVNSIVSGAAYCSPWCNVYTCGAKMCAGCDTCDSLRLMQHCAGWCNPFTTWSGYCKGC